MREMDQKNYNTITLSDLFWKVLSRWWVIVIFAAVGVLAMYRLKVVNYDSDLKAYEDTRRTYNLQMQDYYEQMDFYNEYRTASDKDEETKAVMADKLESFCRSRLNAEQLALVDNAMDIRQLIEDTRKQQNSAFIFNVDPYHIPTLYIIFQVDSENTEWLSTINQYYINADSSDTLWEAVVGKMNWKNPVDCSSLVGATSLTYINSNQFAIRFYENDLADLEQLELCVIEVLQEKREQIVGATGLTHSLQVLESNKYYSADSGIASAQNTYQQWVTGYNNQLNGIIVTMTGLSPQINLYNCLENKVTGGNGYITLNNPTAPKEPEMGKAPYGKKIMLAVGMVIGVILGVVFLLLCMIFSTRIQKVDSLSQNCGMTLLGVLVSETFILPFEKLVRKLRNRKLGSLKAEDRLELTAEKIRAVYDTTMIQEGSPETVKGEKREKQLVLAGTVAGKKNSELLKKLSGKLEAKGIKVTYTGNLLEDSEAFTEALKSGTVVFVEQEICSKFGRIQREQQLVAGCEIKVLGTVGII